MKMFLGFLLAIFLSAGVFAIAHAANPDAPVIYRNGNTITWPPVPNADGYNVYFNGQYSVTIETNSYTASVSGTYMVTSFDKGTSPTSYSVSSNDMDVTVNDAATPATPATEDSTDTPQSEIQPVASQTPPPSTGGLVYSTTFRDDFNGPTISSKWTTPSWQAPDRDAKNSLQPCKQQNGVLHLAIEQVGDERLACYMSSSISSFGPGSDKTMKIEYRADVSQVKARGAWFAGWMYVVSGSGAFDGNPSTGMETDVFEYMPTWTGAYNTAAHDGSSSEKWIDPKNELAVDISEPGFHTYSVEWNKNCQVFSFDGQPVFTNRELISTAENHSIMLSMEAQTGTQWGMWNVGSFAENLRDSGAVGKIDWVKVSEAPGFANICE